MQSEDKGYQDYPILISFFCIVCLNQTTQVSSPTVSINSRMHVYPADESQIGGIMRSEFHC